MRSKPPIALEAAQAAFGEQYAIEHPIGFGAMAVVFFGRSRENSREVAVKVLRPELGASLFAGLFHREIRTLGALNHSNILPMLACHDADNLLAYVMPYAPNGALRNRLAREGQLSLDQTLAVARQVAAALDYLHAQDVLHRDVKPENVVFDADGTALLCDFGLARVLQRATKDGLKTSKILLGTPEYMSPEQVSGRSDDLTHHSDIYALACVVWEMLAGEPPFTGKSFRTVIAKHAQEPPPRIRVPRPDVPARVEAALLSALAKDPAERQASAQELVEQMEG
ncbi:MAG: serine/threonine-protein kinase [Gemmatimonadales bacterium]|jgi:serine/threonine-protein kinase